MLRFPRALKASAPSTLLDTARTITISFRSARKPSTPDPPTHSGDSYQGFCVATFIGLRFSNPSDAVIRR
jgi:hypothetical protein